METAVTAFVAEPEPKATSPFAVFADVLFPIAIESSLLAFELWPIAIAAFPVASEYEPIDIELSVYALEFVPRLTTFCTFKLPPVVYNLVAFVPTIMLLSPSTPPIPAWFPITVLELPFKPLADW